VLIAEAERNKPNSPELDNLIEEYKNSLLIFYYEKQLTDQLLDTVIDNEDIVTYFESHKNQYTLETSIIKCQLIKIKQPVEQTNELRAWWNTNDSLSNSSLLEYCNLHAESFILGEGPWYELAEVQQLIPEQTLDISDVTIGRKRQVSTNDYLYFFELMEKYDKGSIPPLAYVSGRMEHFILYERKQAFLHDLKENLLQRALSNKEAKIFIE
jgi:hypothetical protein